MIYTEPYEELQKETSDKAKHIRLEERLKNYEDEYVYEEIDWGQPVGDEIW